MLSDSNAGDRPITDRDMQAITRAEELAYEMRVSEVMTRDLKTLSPELPMSDALEIFRTVRISGAPVVDEDGMLVGVISLEDVIRCLTSGCTNAPVSQFMSTTVVTVHESDLLIEALKLFVGTRHGRLPVLDDKTNKVLGIITKGDITLGLLNGLKRDYQAEEIRRYRASHLFEDIISDRSSLILRYTIVKGDFTHGGAASSYIKRALLRLGSTPQIARRVGIAAYEAEMNLIIHTTQGGIMRVEIEPHQITMDAYDDGPGIENIKQAMRPGYSTATNEVRELGFGAGMGLVNIQRCADNMQLESTLGQGTRLRMKIFLSKSET